jgi:hypothetical protein
VAIRSIAELQEADMTMIRLVLCLAIAGCSVEPSSLSPAIDAPGPPRADARPASLGDAPPVTEILLMAPHDVHAGDELFIYGRGFGDPAQAVVTLGAEIVRTFKAGSNDSVLILEVPPVSFLVDPSDVTVDVSTPNGFASGSITLHQYVPTVPSGALAVGVEAFPAGIITPGHDYVFGFRIEARTTLDETFDLKPMVPPEWQAVMVSDATGTTELPAPAQVAIARPPPGQVATTAHAFVRVTIPSATADPFVRLDVTSVHNALFLTASSGHIDVPLDAPGPAGQTLLPSISQAHAQGLSGTDLAFDVPTPTSLLDLDGFYLSIWELKPVAYTAAVSWKDSANGNHGWTASLGGGPKNPGWPYTQATLAGPGDAFLSVKLVGIAGATENILVLTVRSMINPDTDYMIFELNVVPLPP